MKFNLEQSPGVRIHAYDPGIITLALPADIPMPAQAESVEDYPALCRLRHNLVLHNRQLHIESAPDNYENINEQHLDYALQLEPEIILLGTGEQLRFPAPHLLSIPAVKGIGMEVMDTAAACRTFNILTGENRQVVAILLVEP